MRKNNHSSNNKAFAFFLGNKERIDKVMKHKNYAEDHINYIIAKEEVDPVLIDCEKNGMKPDWNKIFEKMRKKYEYGNSYKTLLEAQLRWYGHKRDTLSLIRHNVEKIEKYGIDTVGFGKPNLNNMIYYMIFRHTSDKDTLNKAIGWMKTLVEVEPDNGAFLDTYANLLYKVGRKKEALDWEAKAIKLEPDNPELVDAWERMRNEKPTWPAKN